jgi:plastocyanin
VATALAASPAPAFAGDDAAIAGRLTIPIERLRLADVAPAVVYLEALEAPLATLLQASAEVRQHSARFEPDFLVVAVGQRIEMPNDDTIFHNVFSYSKPNAFDLGLYRAGESRTLRFDHAGPVRLYCSIHERMNGLIFVAPSRLFAVPGDSGEYRIKRVPPGRYRLHVWTQRLPELSLPVTLAAGEEARLDVSLGAPTP